MSAHLSVLHESQAKFTEMIGRLIAWSYENGYELTFAEAYRTPEQAAINAKKGTGITHSLHIDRLAVDFNVFKDGVYLTDTPDLTPLGEYFESIGGTWGGRFTSPHQDGNHFSLAYGGRK